MLNHVKKKVENIDSCDASIGCEQEEALVKSFQHHLDGGYRNRIRPSVSKRGEKTYVFPCSNKKDYLKLVGNRNRFKKEVADNLESCAHTTGHKDSCKQPKKYVLAGFRSTAPKTLMEGGEQENFPIRMVKCVDCGQRFSMIPSFLPREKHFGRVQNNNLDFSQTKNACIFVLILIGCVVCDTKPLKQEREQWKPQT